MIARLRGTLRVRELDRVEVMTAGGVGYEVMIPRTIFERLPALGQEVEVVTYHLVREDAVMLFGFLEEAERAVFARLLTASGVGPRLALALLSALPASRLARAIRDRDVQALTAVSGVGRKTAERLVLELAGKLDDIAAASADRRAGGPGVEEAIRALTVLGFPTADAEDAVRESVREGGPSGAQDLIKAALQRLR